MIVVKDLHKNFEGLEVLKGVDLEVKKGERVVFTKCERDRLSCDAVILDESSMVDLPLMDALLRALPPDARLIMVGDADQLPSVGPGNVFSALIRSQIAATVRLTEIFRQKEGSRIVRNAHLINKGEHPDLSENTGGFFRLKRLQAAGSVETITELFSVRLPTKMGIPPEEIQVLSPTRKGETGTVHLNRKLKAENSPSPSDMIKTMRMELASEMLKAGGKTIAEVAEASGFSSASYFSSAFQE